MSNFKQLNINADRICEAISKIGYNPCSAILDIIDNSVVAESKKIIVKLHIKEGTNINSAQNIHHIQIIDNGCGMSDEQIDIALQLGSDVSYKPNSLSKYGLGLKSAGFSLGNRIEVVSKTSDKISLLKYLDRAIIRDKNAFGVSYESTPAEYINELALYNSGTIITIKDIIYTSRFSANKIMMDIYSQAGVHYYEILKNNNIEISLQVIDHENKILKGNSIEPKDMLFWDEAYDSYEKEKYDCKRPCRVLDRSFENPLNPTGEKIKIRATIFPKFKMSTFPEFSEEERSKIKEYEVSLKNSGFYFYRNGRLIKWGEKLYLNRKFGFRAVIDFTTEHDDLFGVDVSKQQLTISEDIEQIIKVLCDIPIDQSDEVFDTCDWLLERERNDKKEGFEFNLRNTTLEEDEEEIPSLNQPEANKRKEKIEEESETKVDQEEPKYENIEKEEGFRRVRYWDKCKNMNLWESCIDRVEGTYVLINKSHTFYQHTLTKLGAGTPSRQSIEALLHALAVGQNQTIQKFLSVDDDVVKQIFEKFERTVSHQLDNWVNSNWDLFDNGD